jgi:hypothetical protein
MTETVVRISSFINLYLAWCVSVFIVLYCHAVLGLETTGVAL